MKTFVNNKSAKYILVSLLIVLISCTCVAAYVSFTTDELTREWYSFSGFLMGVAASLHLGGLLLGNAVFSKLEVTHVALFTIYASVMGCCVMIPACVYAGARNWAFLTVMTCYVLEGGSMLTVLIALYLKDYQSVQYWLHPLQELVDGFPKSSSTVPMQELQQVLVQETAATQNTTSPQPSQKFKTWPKGPPFPVKALYSFKSTTESELPFRRGDELVVLDCRGRWWHAERDSQKGFIPSNYVQVLLKAEAVESFVPEDGNEDEVAVEAGSTVEVMERYEEKCLIRNAEGKIGAIPASKLKFASEASIEAVDAADKENVNDSQTHQDPKQ
jgi:hypothetical protein